jgi:hypothetical protein
VIHCVERSERPSVDVNESLLPKLSEAGVALPSALTDICKQDACQRCGS